MQRNKSLNLAFKSFIENVFNFIVRQKIKNRNLMNHFFHRFLQLSTLFFTPFFYELVFGQLIFLGTYQIMMIKNGKILMKILIRSIFFKKIIKLFTAQKRI